MYACVYVHLCVFEIFDKTVRLSLCMSIHTDVLRMCVYTHDKTVRLFLCISIHTYVLCKCVCMLVCLLFTWACICTDACVWRICACMRVHAYVHVLVRMYTHRRRKADTCIHARICTRAHTRTCATRCSSLYPQNNIHTHTHIPVGQACIFPLVCSHVPRHCMSVRKIPRALRPAGVHPCRSPSALWFYAV